MKEVMRNGSTCLMLMMLAPVVFADGGESKATDEGSAPLSVAPLDVIEYPDDRPSWVSQPLRIEKDSVVMVVVSGPSETSEESLEELELMQRAAISTYIAEVSDSEMYNEYFDIDSISDELIDASRDNEPYAGTVTQGDLTMYEHAVKIRITEDQIQEIQASWKNFELRDRLFGLGLLVFGGLVFMIGSSAIVGLVSRRVERRDRLAAAS